MNTDRVKHLHKEGKYPEHTSYCGRNLNRVLYAYDYQDVTCKVCLGLNKGKLYINGQTFKDHETVSIWDGDHKRGTVDVVLKNRQGKLQWWLMDYWCELKSIKGSYGPMIRKLDYKKYEEPNQYLKSTRTKIADWFILTFASI